MKKVRRGAERRLLRNDILGEVIMFEFNISPEFGRELLRSPSQC